MSQKKKPKFLIIDGHALIHRSFHALPLSLKTSTGEVVNAVYGFASFLLNAIKDIKPDMIALALDKKGATFRHEAYADYKATRVKAPDELHEQVPRVKELAQSLGIPVFEIAGCEADDVIGTLVAKMPETEKIIVTGDLDTLQLIDSHTKIYTMSRGLNDSFIYDEKAVRERFGLSIDQMIEYKALRGDPSDNIPGIKGIGEKTAIDLLQNFKTVKNLYKNIESEKISDRIRQLLKDYKQDALMSLDLATIRKDIKLSFKKEDLSFGNFDREKALKFFQTMEFKSLIPRLLQLKGANKTVALAQEQIRTDNKFSRNKKDLHYKIIDTETEFKKFLTKLKLQKRFAFDTETSDLDSFGSDLLGLSFSFKEGEAYFISIRQKTLAKKTEQKSLFDLKTSNQKIHDWLKKLQPILEDEKIKKIGHNVKFDIKILRQFGVVVAGVDFDTMIAAYLLSPGNRQYSLDNLALHYFNFEKISSENLLGQGKNKLSFKEVPLEKLGLYACEDADITFRLYKKLSQSLKQEKLDKLFTTMEMPLIDCLVEMELNGIGLDIDYLKKLEKEIDLEINKTEKAVWKISGQEFNISSTKQLQDILFNKLKISSFGLSKTKTGISTGAEELLKLKGRHQIIDLILNYRELTKLASTYIRNLPLLVNPITKRLHTNFNQTIAATGRLSSTEPNIQNIPVRTELGRQIRRAFIPQKGNVLLSLDYSQIELRLAAHLSGDPGLIKAFKNNEDIHTATAATINQIPFSKVSSELRRKAKAINFGILYGQGPHGLSQSAEISYEEARNFIDDYFAAYPGVKKFIDQTLINARKNGYVETIFGRRRYLEELNAQNMMMRRAAERMAINAPIQGAAADMIKMAMIKVKNFIEKKYQDKILILLQVHDELLFEMEPKLVKIVSEEIKNIMENVIKLKVPIIVDAKEGANWENMKKI